MAKWNQLSPNYSKSLGPNLSSSDAVRSIAIYGAVAAISALLTRAGPILLRLASLYEYYFYLRLVLVTVFIIAVTLSIKVLAVWRASEETVKAQQGLKNPQRALLGLNEAKTPTPGAARKQTVIPPPQPSPVNTPATPPVRSTIGQSAHRSPWSDPTKGGGHITPGSSYGGLTPLSASSKGQRMSPLLPTTPVTTPEQLRHYEDAFQKETQPAARPMDTSAYESFGYPMSDREGGVGPQLPLGRDAPIYRPSWMARKTKAQGTDTGLQVSGDEEVADFLEKILRIRRRDLDAWTDSLREWVRLVALGPLLHKAEDAHQVVNASLEKLGVGVRVPPLPDVLLGGGGSSDVESMILYCQRHCQAVQPSRPVEAKELHGALQSYQQLLLVLKGKRPTDLLPPTPTGYIWCRLQQLAHSTCLFAFTWNGGGEWNGREWSPDLPTDSALVLYLFAAFLQAPAWDFPEAAGRGMPLYMGTLPSSRLSQYSAILAHRIDKPGSAVDAIMAINLQSPSPMFSLLLKGRTLTLTGPTALFHILLLFLLYHKQEFNGMLGDHYLSDDVVKLACVFEGGNFLTVWRRKLLGW